MKFKLIPIIAATLSFSLSIGMFLVLIPLMLEGRGITYSYIGLNGTIALAMSLFFMPFIPTLAHRLGIIKLAICIFSIRSVCLLLIPYTTGYWDVVAVSWLIGPTGIAYFSIILSWVGDVMPINRKSVGIAVVTICMAGGISLGSLFIEPFVHTKTGFFIAAAMFFSGIIPFLLFQNHLPQLKEKPDINIWNIIKNNPRAFFSQGVCDFTFFSTSNFIVLYGIDYHYPVAEAASLLSFYMLGPVLFNIPVGLLADKANKYILMACGALLLLTIALSLPSLMSYPLLAKITLLLMSASASLLYIPAISLVNHRYHGNNRVAANAALGFNGNFFAMCGTLFSGIAMDMWKPNGLLYSIITVVSLFLVFFISRTIFNIAVKKQHES